MKSEMDRVYTRIRLEDKEKLMLAANELGMTINQFLVQAGLEKAEELIENELTLQLELAERQRFFHLLENPPPPSAYLQQAAYDFQASELIQNDPSSLS